MSIDFYCMYGSPPCASVMLTAKALGIDLIKKMMDYKAGDLDTPEFRKLNPQRMLPTIQDDGYVLAESRAIMVYLVTKYGKDDTLYPNDAKKRGLVEQRLNFDLGTLYKRLWDVYLPAFRGGKPINKDNLSTLKEALEILDGYLSQTKWSAGDHVTVADHALVASIGAFDALGFDLTPYKNVTRWYKDCQKEMPGYKETNQETVDTLGKYAKGVLAGKV